MNLAVRRFILFFFSVAILSACEDPTDIGLNLQDENQIGVEYVDTLTVKTGTVLLGDSILSFNRTPLVGFMSDPFLGTVRATHFTEVGLGGSNLKFGEAPVVDSLVLTLDYNSLYPAKRTSAPLTLNVYRLTESFQEKTTYFTNSPALAYSSSPIGSKTFTPAILQKEVNKDSFQDSARLVRVKLPLQLAQEIVAQSGKDPLANQLNFNNFLKGLALVVEANNPASILGISVAPNTVIKSNQTALTLYYRNGTDKKTHTFGLSDSGVRSFSKIVADRSGTLVSGLQEKGQYIPSEQTNGNSYVQASTQLLTKLTIPHLKNLKDKYGEFVLNRAELILPVKEQTVETSKTEFVRFAPPTELVIYETNSSNRILRTKEGNPKAVQSDLATSFNTYRFPTSLKYDVKREHYTVNITSYVQAILLDKKPNDGLLLAAGTLTPSANGGGSEIVQDTRPLRAVLSNTKDKGVKLRIYLSKLN